jgi:thiamine-phosphate pyrophosphorylase
MAEPVTRLYLITPPIDDADAFAPRLAQACAAGDIAAVLARFAPADERTLTKSVKTLAPAAQEAGAALVIEVPGEVDRAAILTRGGADGVQVAGERAVRDLRERLKGDRIVGAAGIRTRDDAMAIGEAGADYLMFGEPRPDGSVPALEGVAERAGLVGRDLRDPVRRLRPEPRRLSGRSPPRGPSSWPSARAVWTHPEGPAAAVRQALEALAGAAR